MKTIDFSYFIERYNAGEMNESEKTWFEKELTHNKELRNEVELRRQTDKILEDQVVIQLRNKLTAIESQRSVPDPARNRAKHMAIRYAAVFTGLVMIGCLIILSRKPLTADEVLGKFYTSYEVTVSTRSIQAESNPDFKRAIEYFDVHNYSSAAIYFSKVINSDPHNIESTMLYGVSNFEESNYPEAVKSFNTVKENNNSMFVEDAEWYLGLCYLQTGEMEKAVDQFSSIRNSESIYRQKARKILRSIK